MYVVNAAKLVCQARIEYYVAVIGHFCFLHEAMNSS